MLMLGYPKVVSDLPFAQTHALISHIYSSVAAQCKKFDRLIAGEDLHFGLVSIHCTRMKMAAAHRGVVTLMVGSITELNLVEDSRPHEVELRYNIPLEGDDPDKMFALNLAGELIGLLYDILVGKLSDEDKALLRYVLDIQSSHSNAGKQGWVCASDLRAVSHTSKKLNDLVKLGFLVFVYGKYPKRHYRVPAQITHKVSRL